MAAALPNRKCLAVGLPVRDEKDMVDCMDRVAEAADGVLGSSHGWTHLTDLNDIAVDTAKVTGNVPRLETHGCRLLRAELDLPVGADAVFAHIKKEEMLDLLPERQSGAADEREVFKPAAWESSAGMRRRDGEVRVESSWFSMPFPLRAREYVLLHGTCEASRTVYCSSCVVPQVTGASPYDSASVGAAKPKGVPGTNNRVRLAFFAAYRVDEVGPGQSRLTVVRWVDLCGMATAAFSNEASLAWFERAVPNLRLMFGAHRVTRRVAAEEWAKRAVLANMKHLSLGIAINSNGDAEQLADAALADTDALFESSAGWRIAGSARGVDVEMASVYGDSPRLHDRGCKVFRCEIELPAAAADLHRYMCSEDGLALLDPDAEVSDLNKPVEGPFPWRDGSAQVEYAWLRKRGRDCVLLRAAEEASRTSLAVSCTSDLIKGGSLYDEDYENGAVASREGRMRLAIFSACRVVPNGRDQSKLLIARWADPNGLASPASANASLLTWFKEMIPRVTKLLGQRKRRTLGRRSVVPEWVKNMPPPNSKYITVGLPVDDRVDALALADQVASESLPLFYSSVGWTAAATEDGVDIEAARVVGNVDRLRDRGVRMHRCELTLPVSADEAYRFLASEDGVRFIDEGHDETQPGMPQNPVFGPFDWETRKGGPPRDGLVQVNYAWTKLAMPWQSRDRVSLWAFDAESRSVHVVACQHADTPGMSPYDFVGTAERAKARPGPGSRVRTSQFLVLHATPDGPGRCTLHCARWADLNGNASAARSSAQNVAWHVSLIRRAKKHFGTAASAKPAREHRYWSE